MVTRNIGFRFNLVSYNILSQTLLRDHNYLYTECQPEDLEWPRRGQRILKELIRDRADIICLQEVESIHLQSLYKPRLARYGYNCLYKKKTGFKTDGCAIFYKNKLFHLLNHKGIEFNLKDASSILNRDNVGIIAVLKPKIKLEDDSSQLVIANTHLIFNPRRVDIKLAQLNLFLNELEELSIQNQGRSKGEERLHHPTILCGDMNSVPGSDVNNFIVNGFFDGSNSSGVDCLTGCNQPRPSDIEMEEDRQQSLTDSNRQDISDNLRHPFRFKSVYPTRNREGKPYVSTFSNCIVDYIFYTEKLNLISYRELLTENELKSIGPIPNSKFPSDHLSLEADFKMR